MPKKYVVTPWEVTGDVNYEQLINEFGTKHLTDSLLRRLEKVTGELHFHLKRKVFFSHRDFDKILDMHEKREEFALYTGRGPSGNTTLGHALPWMLTKWLQDRFGAELYFEITDAEKYLVKDLTLDQTKGLAYENILDIIAMGFDPKKTFIFLDTELGKTQFRLANEIAKKVTFSTAKAVFGFTNETNIGLIFHPAVQAAPCYLPTYLKGKPVPTLIPAAIDQDPYWRVTRDIARKVGFPKPCQIHCRFLPALQQLGKMSSSQASTAIFTTDDEKTVEAKIKKYAFSGGKDTVAEHRKRGGNPDIDVSYQYLTFFEEDDQKIKEIYHDYKSGELLSGELKQICADTINNFLSEHQERREKAKNLIEQFMLRD
jgi:tryptophanyl-tRNA synthetase